MVIVQLCVGIGAVLQSKLDRMYIKGLKGTTSTGATWRKTVGQLVTFDLYNVDLMPSSICTTIMNPLILTLIKL